MNKTQVILPITDPNRPDFAWLNEDSKLFLQRGYLLEGTSALERIRFIAEYASWTAPRPKTASAPSPTTPAKSSMTPPLLTASITTWRAAITRFLHRFGRISDWIVG